MNTKNKEKGYVDPEYLRFIGEFINPLKKKTYDSMKIKPGHNVLDLGCGPGADTVPLAKLVGSDGNVIGADYDEAALDEARLYAKMEGVDTWCSHWLVEATKLPFATDYFDACRSGQVLQHLPDATKAFAEMVRVTKPGGSVVVLDADWGSLSIASDEVAIERRLTRFLSDSFVHNGYSGRNLYRLFKQQNLADIAIEAMAVSTTNYAIAKGLICLDRVELDALNAGIITSSELNQWRSSLDKSSEEGTFFSSVNMIMLSGIKIGQGG